jgi:hypothetical protein
MFTTDDDHKVDPEFERLTRQGALNPYLVSVPEFRMLVEVPATCPFQAATRATMMLEENEFPKSIREGDDVGYEFLVAASDRPDGIVDRFLGVPFVYPPCCPNPYCEGTAKVIYMGRAEMPVLDSLGALQ